MDETWWKNPDQLDPYQQDIIVLPLEGSHLVVGPPGSGKTNLLLLRATYLTRAGLPNIAIVTFNRMLREFIISGSGNYPFEPERVQTFRSWAVDVLKNNSIDVDTDCDFDDLRAKLLAGLESLSEEQRASQKFDCVLIDEVQDYFVDELKAVRGFADTMFVVGDDNQRIYRAAGSLDYLRTFCNAPDSLTFHYRNGMAICRLADGIMGVQDGGMVDTCNYDEVRYPSSVARYGPLRLDDQVDRSVDLLETQVLAYPDEWIGVLAPRKDDVKAVFDRLSKSKVGHLVQLQRFSDGYERLTREKPIIVTTMHSAKGLEFRTTHLFAFENVTRLDNHQKVSYTAVTRAKTSVSIYHDKALPGYLERGLVAVEGPPTRAPGLSELFGDKA